MPFLKVTFQTTEIIKISNSTCRCQPSEGMPQPSKTDSGLKSLLKWGVIGNILVTTYEVPIRINCGDPLCGTVIRVNIDVLYM